MNQILFVEKSKKGGPLEINTIIKIFAIIIIIFGIIITVKGVYGVISSSNKVEAGTEPVVTINEKDGKLELNVIHEKIIDKITYSWNENQEYVLQGKGRNQITETIDIPIGNNILQLTIIDIDKKTVKYSKEYYRAEGDIISPEIEFAVDGSKVKIVVKDETELSYMSYHWNDEDDTVVNAREDSKKQIEEKISILKGENTLTIVAVDAAGNETKKEQIFKGAKKPTIETLQENDELIIKVSDEENIQKIELNVNGEFFSTDYENTGVALNLKDAELRQKLKEGENTIIITVYNVSGLSEQKTEQITI